MFCGLDDSTLSVNCGSDVLEPGETEPVLCSSTNSAGLLPEGSSIEDSGELADKLSSSLKMNSNQLLTSNQTLKIKINISFIEIHRPCQRFNM
ncbi:hypothetical protein Hanom_Chr09g00870281 [Helianthus anomalus]